MRPIDVDDVERHGDSSRASGLGNELLGDEVWRDLIEDPCYLQRKWRLASQLAWRTKRHRRDAALKPCSGYRIRHVDPGKRLFDRLTRGEVAILRRSTDFCRRSQLGHRDAAAHFQHPVGSKNPLAASDAISAQARWTAFWLTLGR